METFTTVDKSTWGPGPWQTEPDKIVWVDAETGLDCMIHRNPVGALCGYVGVPPGHPWHGAEYHDIEADVHGGLTYSRPCDPRATPEDGVCHISAPGRPDHIWWLGFDCIHAFDYAPKMAAESRQWLPEELWHHNHEPGTGDMFAEVYKTVEYVRAEVESLARQAAGVPPRSGVAPEPEPD
jgi:hypothetical protein